MLFLPKLLAKYKMKKTLLIALLLIPFLGISQTTKPIESVFGLKFGSNMDDIIAALNAKGAVMFNGKTNERVVFRNIKLGQREPLQLEFLLVNNKMYQGTFYFKADQEPKTIEYYNALVKDISDVYGKGTPYKNFKSPYEDGDGHEITAISLGYATCFTNWTSPNGESSIQVTMRSIKDELYILLIYSDDTLAKEAQQKEKEKAKADF